uniref:DUF4139 domain-containing protein n=1 Tax=Mycena chlorophos TaxID=658473 RepID=A0ABQ0LCT6_MYCCL|nr:predicted protein [Mycena chlorophos]
MPQGTRAGAPSHCLSFHSTTSAHGLFIRPRPTTTTMAAEPSTANPPPFSGGPTASIEHRASTASQITSVSVYSARAEVALAENGRSGQRRTRRLNIIQRRSELDLEKSSSNNSSRGDRVLHNSSPSSMPLPRGLQAARINESIPAVAGLLKSLTIEHIDATKLAGALRGYDATTKVLDGCTAEGDPKTRLSIGVFAEVEGQGEIVLIYAVSRASWTPLYDLRMNTDTKEKPITRLYKAAMQQETGESWNEVPLPLETSLPTSGAKIPEIQHWDLHDFLGHVSVAVEGGFLGLPVSSVLWYLVRRRFTYLHVGNPSVKGSNGPSATAGAVHLPRALCVAQAISEFEAKPPTLSGCSR